MNHRRRDPTPPRRPIRGPGRPARIGRAVAGPLLVATLLTGAPACDGDPSPTARSPEEPAVVARRITSRDDLIGGRRADGAVGDYLMRNRRIRLILQGPGPSRSFLCAWGGALLDADLVRPAGQPGQDLLVTLFPSVTLNGTRPLTIEVLLDGSDGPPAIVRVTGEMDTFGYLPAFLNLDEIFEADVVTDYILDADVPHVRIVTTVTNRGTHKIAPMLAGDVGLMGGTLDLFAPGDGFDLPGYTPAPALASQGSGERVCYGLAPVSGDLEVLGEISGIFLPVYRLGTLAPGARLTYERVFVVGDGTAASVLAEIAAVRGEPTGTVAVRVEDAEGGEAVPGIRVDVFTPGEGDPIPLAAAYTDPGGRVDLQLPEGDYRMRAESEERALPDLAAVEVRAGVRSDLTLPAGSSGRVAYAVRDGSGRLLPARLVFSGPSSRIVTTASGSGEVRLPPGTYEVTVTRGFEYTVDTLLQEVPAGGRVTIEAGLERVVDSAGWVAADFHLHAEPSSDSQMSLADRVAAVLAEGLELVAATDHDVLTDYTPTIRALGAADRLRSVIGDEISTTFFGHFQGFPLTPNPNLAGEGAVPWPGLTPTELFAAIHADPAAAVVQLNHPRMDALAGYLETIQYNRETDRPDQTPEAVGFPPGTELLSFDFDVVEVFNGKVPRQDAEALLDYFALLDHGHRVAMTGNSDSHGLSAFPGYPRTYVRATPDAPAQMDVAGVIENLRSCQAMVCGGPFVTFRVNGEAGIGDVLRTPAGEVELEIRVQAPPWMDVDEVEVIANGATAALLPVPETDDVLRLEETLRLRLDRDTWVVVAARGDAPMALYRGRLPASITNPVWLDVDGGGFRGALEPPSDFGEAGPSADLSGVLTGG